MITERGVVRLTIDTETDSYEQAIAALQAAYGLRPVVPGTWPPAPAPDRYAELIPASRLDVCVDVMRPRTR